MSEDQEEPGPRRRLPQRYVETGLEKARGSLFMGAPLEELSREELLAVAAHGWGAYDRERKDRLNEVCGLLEVVGR